MSLEFHRNFNMGRQSEQFLNDELTILYETLKYLPHHKYENGRHGEMPPDAQVSGALNAQPSDGTLNYWDNSKNTWVPFFKSKFQIVDQMLQNTCPSDPVVGQLWINNGVLCYFDGDSWHPIKAINMDDSQWSSTAFSDFQIVSPLNPTKDAVVEIGGYQFTIKENEPLDRTPDDYWKYYYDNKLDYENNSSIINTENRWYPNWLSPELPEPVKVAMGDAMRSQFVIPNLNTDRIFKNHDYDTSYSKISSVCIEYPTKEIINEDISAIHLNPGRLTNIIKRLIKIDKLNSTIAIKAYNTEFYGFRNGENTGDFLIPSDKQDWGDYIPAGDHIILNYNATQNYDYLLAITYEFSWMKADGKLDCRNINNLSNSYFLTDLKVPLNVHTNGLKLEEASYSVNVPDQTVTINDDTEHVEIAAWSPYKKQFGYIRETDLQHRGIIQLREPVANPLVFVSGTLINPISSGLEFSQDGKFVYVPNSGEFNQMAGMSWCVVDLIDPSVSGEVIAEQNSYVGGSNDQLTNNSVYYQGQLSQQPDEHGIYDYVLTGGVVETAGNNVINYDTSKIRSEDDVILFIDGLLVNKNKIVRDKVNGIITLSDDELNIGQEYVLIKDTQGILYDTANMMPAFNTGYISNSLIYINGKLLAEPGCVNTLNNPENELAVGVIDRQIKFFIIDEDTGSGYWRWFDQFSGEWKELTPEEETSIKNITESYTNQLTSVSLNIQYNRDEDNIAIYAFKFANDLVGITTCGEASYGGRDPEDNNLIYRLSDYYGYNSNTLNVYMNGVKLIRGQEYQEMVSGLQIKMLIDVGNTDVIHYVIEPIERGYSEGHTRVVLTKDDALQGNIYKVPDELGISLYPGRVTVYINGIRIPNTDWSLLSDKTILLKYIDYKAVGSANNFPEEELVDENYLPITITHKTEDIILVEIRNDYDRKEKTIYLDPTTDITELYMDDYDLPHDILESSDEVLFYLNGQFTGLSRNKDNSYKLDIYKGCIIFRDSKLIAACAIDKVKSLLTGSNVVYNAWRRLNHKESYENTNKKALTIVWR